MIREATEQDAPELARLLTALGHPTVAFFRHIGYQQTSARFMKELQK